MTQKESSLKNIGKIKKDLTNKKIELEATITQLHNEKFSDGQVQDFGDQALSSSMEALQSSLQDTRIEEYNRIVKALKMIDEGEYGICADCQAIISEKRLKSYPNATRCISCQEAHEEKKGSF